MTDPAWAAETTWDALAGRYGRQEGLERRGLATVVRLAAVTPQDRVVDLATGTGALLRALARERGRPRAATGVDRSAGMLAEIGPLPDGWTTVRAPATDTPLPDGCADLVTCCHLLHLLDPGERAAVLAEARRLLAARPGARLVVVTPWADPARTGGRLVGLAMRAVARARPTVWGGLTTLDPHEPVEAAGLRVVRRVVLPRGGYPSVVLRAERR